MKRMTLILAVFSVAITACGSARANPMASGGGGAMQPMTELIVGTLKLEGTNEAVTKEQAAELLPLWQVYRDVSTSDTAAQQEIDGLTEQIQEAMTDAQRKSISAMKLTREDVMAVMQEGLSAGTGPVARGSSTTGQGNNAFPRGGFGDGMPPGGAGGMPDGGFGPGGGFGGGTQAAGTPQANGQQTGARGSGVPAPLLNALIRYLEEKAGS